MGSLDGVVSTRVAWVGSREVVEVEFRPDVLSFGSLLDHAIASSCDQRVFATTDAQLESARKRVGERAERFDGEVRVAKSSDQLYYLGRSNLRDLPLTPVQARKVNSALGRDETDAHPETFLSPRQRALAERIAAVLKKEPRALDGLRRPDRLSDLDEYEAELRERLNGREGE